MTTLCKYGIIVLFCVFFPLLPQAGVAGKVLDGTVIKVIDGDSILVRSGGKTYEVRLWGIDCPEYNQPYASHARKATRKLTEKKTVRVEIKDRDSYGRYIGLVRRNSLIVNEELVRNGAAWVYTRYCRESICKTWKDLEKRARKKKIGLWKGKKIVAPWDWRRRSR